MNIKEYKKVLEDEKKKGNSIESEKVEEAKKELLEANENDEEISQILFSLENHTIEYSIQMLDEYLKKEDTPENEEPKNNKFTCIKIVFIVAICVAALITLFTIIFSKLN